MKPLSEQLRDAIEKSGMTRYELSKKTGVSQSTLSKFILGQRPGLSFGALDRIGQELGLVIVKKSPAKKNSTKKAK